MATTVKSGHGRSLRAWALIAVFLACHLCAPAKTLRVQGLVTYTLYDGRGIVSRTESEQFSMDVDKLGRYLIRLREPRSGSDYYEVGYDGTNSYYLNNLSTVVARARAKDPAKVGPNVATGIIRASPVPQFPFADCADPLWLTYASSSFFRGKAQDVMVPPAASNGCPDGGGPLEPSDFIELPARFVLQGDWLARLSYLHPGTYLQGGERLPEPFGAGFTNVTFRIDAFANFGTETPLPARATMETFYFAPHPQPRIVKRIEYQVDCTNALSLERSDFKPAIPGTTSFADERFNNAKYKTLHFSYLTNSWLSGAEARALPQYRKAATMVGPPPSPALLRLAFVFSIGTVVFMGVRLLILKPPQATGGEVQHSEP